MDIDKMTQHQLRRVCLQLAERMYQTAGTMTRRPLAGRGWMQPTMRWPALTISATMDDHHDGGSDGGARGERTKWPQTASTDLQLCSDPKKAALKRLATDLETIVSAIETMN
jgi:hypothetical protein